MSLGLLGRKKGMTQIFNEAGELIPVTVLEVGPCTVVQAKTKESQGYNALQLGFSPMKKEKRATKAYRGHFTKKNLPVFSSLKEFRTAASKDFTVGQSLTVAGFQKGDLINVQALTKGRGFQGPVKRHGKKGSPDSHGHSICHRTLGSVGQNTSPGRVHKNMRMAGRYGMETVMIRNLEVIDVKPEENLLLLKGAIPGARENVVTLLSCNKDFAGRFKAEAPKVEVASEEVKPEAPKEEVKG